MNKYELLSELDELSWLLRYGDEEEIIKLRFRIAQALNVSSVKLEKVRNWSNIE